MTTDLKNRHLFFFGKTAGMSRRDAETLVRSNGAKIASALGPEVDMIVVGESNPLGKDWMRLTESLDAATRDAFETGKLDILTETQFWRLLGLDSVSSPSHPAYTPAMLAELTQIPTAAIRLWFRRGFLIPIRQIGKLPYFDFQEILAAKQLRTLSDAGYSPENLTKIIGQLEKRFPETDRILPHLTLAPDHKTILFRQDGRLFDSAGQRFFNFDDSLTANGSASPSDSEDFDGEKAPCPINADLKTGSDSALSVFPETQSILDSVFSPSSGKCLPDSPPLRPDELTDQDKRAFEKAMGERIVSLCEIAQEREGTGQLEEALDCYRTALALGGADADVSFQLAELLTRMDRLEAARERYFIVLELEEDHLEARVGLGRVLTRLKEFEEAVSVFRGALAIHPDYFEVHFLLGELLFRLHQWAEAQEHLTLFCNADPDSPQIDRVDRMLKEIRLG